MHGLKRYYQCNELLCTFSFPMLLVHGRPSRLIIQLPPYPRFCDRCLAQQGKSPPNHLDYRNIGHTAVWPLTLVDHATYVNLDRDSMSPWAQVPGFHFMLISFDWMHNIYLGTARDLCASALKVLTDRFGTLDGSPDQPDNVDQLLAIVHQYMRDTCAKHGCLV